MSRGRGVLQKRATVRIRTLQLLVLTGSVIVAQGQTAPSSATQQKDTASNMSRKALEPPGERAWNILREGLKQTNADRRAKAVRALGLLTGVRPESCWSDCLTRR